MNNLVMKCVVSLAFLLSSFLLLWFHLAPVDEFVMPDFLKDALSERHQIAQRACTLDVSSRAPLD
jgi:hypothetical protein